MVMGAGQYMDSDNELFTKLRIDMAVLSTKLEKAEEALELAHRNNLASVALAITITGVVVGAILKFFA